MNYKFSIIIPAYNVGEIIINHIKNLLKQTYTNFEVIIVDDGSSDSTFEKINELVKLDARVIAVHKSNGGQISARVKGIKYASSDYCLFMDADDSFELEALKIINDSLNRKESDMIIFNANYVNKDGKKKKYLLNYKDRETYFTDKEIYTFKREVICTRKFNNIWLKAFKTSLIKDVYAYEDITYVRAEEDLLMQLPYFDRVKSITYIPQVLYNYEFNENSVTNNFSEYKFCGAVFVDKQLRKYAEKWHIGESEFICNTRFLEEVIVALKQLKYSNYNRKQKKIYLKEICTNERFRFIIREKNNLTIKQKIFLNLCYLKKYLFILKIIEVEK